MDHRRISLKLMVTQEPSVNLKKNENQTKKNSVAVKYNSITDYWLDWLDVSVVEGTTVQRFTTVPLLLDARWCYPSYMSLPASMT